jgi:SNF2 family DNA or RNA helicase
MQLLSKLLPALRAKGHRVLLFCQMTRMLDILDDWLRASGVGMERDLTDQTGVRAKRVFARIDGSTPGTGTCGIYQIQTHCLPPFFDYTSH